MDLDLGDARDLEYFAGAGGWSEALAALDRTALGVEHNGPACETARSAGHRRLWADVRDLRGAKTSRPVRGFIVSPPCQTFSVAGKKTGRGQLSSLLQALGEVAMGCTPEDALSRTPHAGELDERSALLLEPMLAIVQYQPEWVAMEQVLGTLVVWEAYAARLRTMGYSVAVGELRAEQYGVPQTRRRSILMAHRSRIVQLPAPTHGRYYWTGKLDPGLPRWVSMADALGWGWGEPPDERRATVIAEMSGRIYNQSGSSFNLAWPLDRPATTVLGRELIGMPGGNANGHTRTITKSRNDGIRVVPSEAGVLQTFPADYPWTGTAEERFQQVGDAIPVKLAEAVLRELV